MISKINLSNFRNHDEYSVELEEKVVFVGPNASGKTNLLEAIFTGITGNGFRGSDFELIKNNQPWSRIDIETNTGLRSVKIKSDHAGKTTKILELDGVKKPIRSFRKDAAAVLFEPNELRMLSGPPELRRAWMDKLLTQTSLFYEDSLKRYRRALFQRNNLLKKSASQDELFVWELKLGEYGEQLVAARSDLFNDLSNKIELLYQNIANTKDKIDIAYTNQQIESYASWLIGKLESDRERDKLAGFTVNGPHRDDFTISRNGTNISDTGSRGELRSLVLALKFYELEKLEAYLNIKPLLLLDDVFSELDSVRRQSLLETTSRYQSIFTTTDPPDSISSSTRVIRLAP